MPATDSAIVRPVLAEVAQTPAAQQNQTGYPARAARWLRDLQRAQMVVVGASLFVARTMMRVAVILEQQLVAWPGTVAVSRPTVADGRHYSADCDLDRAIAHPAFPPLGAARHWS